MRYAQTWGKKLKERVAEYMTRPRMVIRARSFYSRADLRLYMKKRIALAIFVGVVDLYVWSTVIIQSIPMVEHAMAGESVVITREDSGVVGFSPTPNTKESTDGVVCEPSAPSQEQAPPDSQSPTSEERTAPSAPIPSSEVEAMILEAFKDTGEAHIALAVAKSESGLRADAVGDIPLEYQHEGKTIGHSCGLFQIRVLPGRPDCETLKDTKVNIEYARKLYDKSGFYPWSNWKNGAFKKFL